MLHEVLFIIFEVLMVLILSTSLIAGWWLLWTWWKEKTGYNKELIEFEAESHVQTLVDDLREELQTIKIELKQIRKLFAQTHKKNEN